MGLVLWLLHCVVPAMFPYGEGCIMGDSAIREALRVLAVPRRLPTLL